MEYYSAIIRNEFLIGIIIEIDLEWIRLSEKKPLWKDHILFDSISIKDFTFYISSVQLSRVWLCDPMDCSMPPCPSPAPWVYWNSFPLSWWYCTWNGRLIELRTNCWLPEVRETGGYDYKGHREGSLCWWNCSVSWYGDVYLSLHLWWYYIEPTIFVCAHSFF